MHRVVIVGAGLAGVHTAERLRSRGFHGQIVLVGGETHLPYDRPPLSKTALRSRDALCPLLDGGRLAALGVEVRLGWPAQALNTTARHVQLDDGSTLDFDYLVIATGAEPRLLSDMPMLRDLHALRTWDDCVSIRTKLPEASQVVVIGGGFIGCEVAATLRSLGKKVSLIESLPMPLAGVLGVQVGKLISAKHEAAGVDLFCGSTVAALAGTTRAEGVKLSSGQILPADLVVLGLGVRPATAWLEGSAVEVGDGVICDEYLQTAVSGVYAVGDVASWPEPGTGRLRRLEHWTNAREMANVAAANICADADRTGWAPAVSYAPVPYFWSDQYDMKIQALGFPSSAANVQVLTVGDGKHLALYEDGGLLVAAVALSAPRHLMSLRPLILRGATIGESRRVITE